MITRIRGGQEIELRSFALTDMARWGWSDLRNAGIVQENDARGVPALTRAVKLRSEAVASLRLCTWSGYGVDKIKREGPGIWQYQLFKDPRPNPLQTRFGFWDTVEESMAWRNNAFIWKNVDPLTERIVEWYALHPDQVSIPRRGQFKVQVNTGYIDPVGRGDGATYTVGPETVLHIRGYGDGGSLLAPTQIQLFRQSIAGPVGRQRHEARMWKRGATLQTAVAFPAGITTAQANEWKDNYRAQYEGTDGETSIVIGGGATIAPIGMTQADAQFAEMAKLTTEDASRIMSVPANLLGVQLDRAVPNLEQDLSTWLRFGLSPELERIESALEADEQLFPKGAQTYPGFDTQEFVRGDLLTEATILGSLVQQGIITPDEARTRLWGGLEPLPDGLGNIPQVTPVGGAPNPAPVPAASSNGSGEY